MGMEIMDMTQMERLLINADDRIGAPVVARYMPAFIKMYEAGWIGRTGGLTRFGQIARQRAMRRLEDAAFSA